MTIEPNFVKQEGSVAWVCYWYALSLLRYKFTIAKNFLSQCLICHVIHCLTCEFLYLGLQILQNKIIYGRINLAQMICRLIIASRLHLYYIYVSDYLNDWDSCYRGSWNIPADGDGCVCIYLSSVIYYASKCISWDDFGSGKFVRHCIHPVGIHLLLSPCL